jgi:hypothetical protein
MSTNNVHTVDVNINYLSNLSRLTFLKLTKEQVTAEAIDLYINEFCVISFPYITSIINNFKSSR